MTTEKDRERWRRWRENNPDKVKAQWKRRLLREKGLLPPWEGPQKLSPEEIQARHIARMKEHHRKRKERMANDPEYAAKVRAREQERHKARYAKLKANKPAYDARLEAEKIRRQKEKKPKAEKVKIVRPKLTQEERLARQRERKREYNKRRRDAERLKRAAEVEAAKAMEPPKPPQAVSPDPPELVALFKKASKGEPVRPAAPYVKKRSAFQIRGWI